MSNENNRKSNQHRRQFLKRAGVTASALALTPGMVAARPGKGKGSDRGKGKGKGKPVEVVTASKEQRVGPNTPGLSKREHEDYVAKMREKWGDQGVYGIQPDVSTQDTLPHTTENLTYVNSWPGHLEATDNDGTVIAESDNQVALYKSDVQDVYGREHYFYWHWTAGQSRDYLTFTGNLWNMWNRISLNSGYDMLGYNPDDDLTRNGKTYTVSLGAEYQGVGVGIEGDFTLFEDKVRPHPNYTEVGDNGTFAVQWIGDYEGSQSFNGTCETRRPNGAGRDFTYKFYLKAGKYKKTA